MWNKVLGGFVYRRHLDTECNENEDRTTTAEMEENQTSESVAVLPDMSEPLTSETEESSGLTTEHESHPVAVTSVQGVSTVQGVPVSLPVGSIIGVANSSNGTTFNVITSDQLQVDIHHCDDTCRVSASSYQLLSLILVLPD